MTFSAEAFPEEGCGNDNRRSQVCKLLRHVQKRHEESISPGLRHFLDPQVVDLVSHSWAKAQHLNSWKLLKNLVRFCNSQLNTFVPSGHFRTSGSAKKKKGAKIGAQDRNQSKETGASNESR